jgi:phytoene/squalene synthetase
VRYSTSFSLGIKCLQKRFQEPVYNIYGFVRFADEIVDTFHDYDKEQLLRDFIADTYKAIDQRISLNPILNSLQKTVHEYNIPRELIETFLRSMEMDLQPIEYTSEHFREYILGSAEVVGLMCLKVFCEKREDLYAELKEPAMRLGAAFQKINFLRDLREDIELLNRVYFPSLDIAAFNEEAKRKIEIDIAEDFLAAFQGIVKLPPAARFGVYLAYSYYIELFRKIRGVSAERIMHERIRVSDWKKALILVQTFLRDRCNRISQLV